MCLKEDLKEETDASKMQLCYRLALTLSCFLQLVDGRQQFATVHQRFDAAQLQSSKVKASSGNRLWAAHWVAMS